MLFQYYESAEYPHSRHHSPQKKIIKKGIRIIPRIVPLNELSMTVLLPLNVVNTFERFASPHKRTSISLSTDSPSHPTPLHSHFPFYHTSLGLLPISFAPLPRCSSSPFSSPPSPSSLRRPHCLSMSPPTPADGAMRSSTRPPSSHPARELSGRSAHNRSSHGTRPAFRREPREIRAPSCLATTTTLDLNI